MLLWNASNLTIGIVKESRLNFTNGFNLAVAQFLANLDAVALLQSFPYNGNPTRALKTTSLKCCFPSTDVIDRREKITHANES